MPGKNINCLVIDDNELDRQAVTTQLAKFAFISLAGSFSDAAGALTMLNTTDINLLLLDIDMPGMDGLTFLKSLQNPPLCVFITSHPEYALAGFESEAFDYILKPVQKERLERALNRVKDFFELQAKAELYDINFSQDSLIIKQSHDFIQIKISDIIYLEALKDYTKVITSYKSYLTLANLKTFFEKLPGKRFLRIHRSYVVATQYITKLERNELLLGHITLPVGKTFKQEVSRTLKQYNH